jgi:molybdopterin synthase sulfur carrier subunit
MLVTIKYFGQIAEATQKDEEIFAFSGGLVSELLNSLYEKYSALKNIDFKVAQNQELVSDKSKITGEEIALLPPFAGG